MVCHVVRYFEKVLKVEKWGVLHSGKVYPLEGSYSTTEEFLVSGGKNEAYKMLEEIINRTCLRESIAYQEIKVLSPITKGKLVLCQGVNYRQHMIESGMDPDAKEFNMFFHKSSSSICSAVDNVPVPDFVKLLDYEIELGLVIGAKNIGERVINKGNIHELVAGIIIANDLSARDKQIPQMQFFKGKSYKNFCPLGPILCLLEKEDMHYLHEMDMELRVNDQVRQRDNTMNLVFKPEETLTEMTQITNFSPGDIVLTGTPSGCAMRIPGSGLKRLIFQNMPEKIKWKTFIKAQLKIPKYLKLGDKISAKIKSTDGKLDLGTQTTVIES